MTADKLCGGGAVTKDEARALEVITGETRFITSGENSTVTDAAEELTREAITSTNESGDICRIVRHDRDDMEKSMQYMPDALEKALEAATTGHAWDDPSPTLKRDEVTAGIMKDVLDSYGRGRHVGTR
ncbi:hypothetical protein [Streptomyces niveus]|uniref:hypothetical protein n=1 Tax=Streptomyces niveus TaxID=193462 RepID=UPI0034181DC0